jgi:hypothetical protein
MTSRRLLSSLAKGCPSCCQTTVSFSSPAYRSGCRVISSHICVSAGPSEASARRVNDIVVAWMVQVAHRPYPHHDQRSGLDRGGASRPKSRSCARHVGDDRGCKPRRVDELRAIVGVLREGDTNGAPLRPSPGIDDLPELVRRTHYDGVAVHMAIVGDAPQRLQEAVSLAVYRIVQESLTNARRHYPGAAVQFAAPGRRGLGSWSESPLVAGARATVTRRPRRRSPYLRPEGLLRRPLPPSRSVCRPECRGATRIGADCPQPVRRRRWPAIQPGRSLWRSGTEPGRRSAPPPTASSPQAPPARP